MTFVEGAHAKILKNPRKMGNLFGKFAFVSMYGSMVFVTGAGLTSNIRDNISDRMNYIWPAPAAGAVLGMTRTYQFLFFINSLSVDTICLH